MIPDPQVQELIKANIQRSKVIQDQVLSLILVNITILINIIHDGPSIFSWHLSCTCFFSGERGERYVPKHFRAQAEDPGHHPQIPEQEESQRAKRRLRKRRQKSWAREAQFCHQPNISFLVNSIVHKLYATT